MTSTPMKTPSSKSQPSAAATSMLRRAPPPAMDSISSSSGNTSSDSTKSRFEAYNRLQAAAVAFGEKLPIPEIVAIGGQSDGKSSLLEALLGFRFNVREVEMGTRRPLVLQMVHDLTALEPRCRFQDEDSEEYGNPMVLSSAIADLIRSRTETHLRNVQAAVSSKPIVMRAEYAHCPNLTIIDTPGFVLKAKKGEPESTPNDILSMVKSLASPPHRILLFLQQSSVEWCSSLWLDSIREIDPTFKRTIIVVSKFDNRLKEFTERWEIDSYLSASGYLGDTTHPFFVALPKDRGTISNEEFRRQIHQVDTDILRHMRENIKGGFSEEKYGPYVGFSSLKKFLENELQKRYKEAAPATLALLEHRCSEVSMEMARIDFKLQATSDVAHLRRAAMMHAASICSHLGALIDGAADPSPEQWGKTTAEELMHSGINSWPGVTANIKPTNSSLRLYGGAAFERVLHEFRCATYSIECPPVSREKVANILLAHAGRGGNGVVMEAAAEIARAAARAWLAPLLDTACDRLAFVLQSLFDLAMERSRTYESQYQQNTEDMEGYVGFLAALRCTYSNFIRNLSKECKQLVRHHLDSVTSPYSHICYEPEPNPIHQLGHLQSATIFDLADLHSSQQSTSKAADQENIPPPQNDQPLTPGKHPADSKEVLRESQLTVPETPSPDQPIDIYGGKKKEIGNNNNVVEGGGAKKRQARVVPYAKNPDLGRDRINGYILGGNDIGSRLGSPYANICSVSAQHFARIREVLIERNVPSALNSGFLTPCRDRLFLAVGTELFAVNDEKFMDMFVAPGAIESIRMERQSLQKRQKTLQSCLTEFKNISRSL
ncbi:dynamin-related protein 5A [Carex littledalei]|uniref:Dynamin-related protein 5A n=1 Tax=Carex littledalei TaxID=544730 RepID=A0A833RH66_9POAL|nr:dynamin-related protein 5A [Carex littledalei]